MVQSTKLAIIGSGPAGLTAAIYAARAQLQPIVIEGPTPGGQLTSTTFIENWPGYTRILGSDLMQQMKDQAQQCGALFEPQSVQLVDFKTRPFKIQLTNQTTIAAATVIIATGSQHKPLRCDGEETYWNKGVSTCAVCDGVLYQDQPIVIAGGGDSAMENALFMTRFTNQITIVQIEPTLTASRVMQDRVLGHPAIRIIYNSRITKIIGDGQKVTNVQITHTQSQQTQFLPTSAVFIAIGLVPLTALFKGQLNLDLSGHLVLNHRTQTSIPGIFAAGDVCDKQYRQAITAAGFGCMAALDAERYLNAQSL